MSQTETLKQAIYALINGDSDTARSSINSVINAKSKQITEMMGNKKKPCDYEMEEECDMEYDCDKDHKHTDKCKKVEKKSKK